MTIGSKNNTKKCGYCASTELVTDDNTGETICSKCAVVTENENRESNSPERFMQSEEGDNRRAGAPTSLTMHDMGLATVIGKKNVYSTGKPLSSVTKSTIDRLRTWDSRSQTKNTYDRNLRVAMGELSRIKDKIVVPEATIEKAAYYYRKALEKKLTKGRNIPVIIASCLYVACRQDSIPRNLNDIYMASNLKKKDIASCYRLLLRELDIIPPVVDSRFVVSRITTILNIPEKITRLATEYLTKAKELGDTAGKDPMGMAAATIYLACINNGMTVTQREIADAAHVTEVTIRNRLNRLRVILFPKTTDGEDE